MKRIYQFIFLLVIISIFNASCSSASNNIFSKYQTGTGASPSLEKLTFDDMIEEADIIADIEIMETIESTNENDLYVIHNAHIIECIKEKINIADYSIKVKQFGNNRYQAKNYPIFKSGDRKIVFLKRTKTDQSMFYILGEYTGVIDIEEINGITYAIKRFNSFDIFKNKNETKLFNKNPVEAEKSFITQIVKYSQAINMMKSYINDKGLKQ